MIKILTSAVGIAWVAKSGFSVRIKIIERFGLLVRIHICGEFSLSVRVGREVLLAARSGQRPPSGRVALLSAWVKAFKPYHHGAGRKSGSFL